LFRASQMVDTPQGPTLDPSLATYRVHDDARTMRTVCERIASLPDHVVVEADLKQAMGFRKALGHREWRKIKVGGWAGQALAGENKRYQWAVW
jgi:hypothetical protein